ncbi:hypothetical protein LCGC14_2818410, partial [marine sediment metagenome]
LVITAERQYALGQITETDLAQILLHTKALSINQVGEIDLAQAIAGVTIIFDRPTRLLDVVMVQSTLTNIVMI